MKKTRVSYPKQAKEILHQKKAPKSVQTKSFESVDLFEENQNIKQQLDELESQKDLGQLGGQVDTSGLQSKLTAGTNISISDQNVISATNTTYTAGTNVSINGNNVISATDTTYTAGTNVTIDQNNVISATCMTAGEQDLAQINQQIADLQKEVGILNGTYDENKLDETFAEIGQGVVMNESDFYERQLEIEGTGTNEILPPNVIFSTQDSTADIDLTLKFIPTNYEGTLNINVFDGEIQIGNFNQSFEATDLDVEQTFSQTIPNYSCLTSAHNLYFVCTTDNSTTAIKITYMKVLITSTNVVVQNKIQPFDVQFNYYTNTYYLSDCSSGTAKICEINANDLNKTSDIVWTDTGIEAQNYKTCFTTISQNNTLSIGEKFVVINQKNKRFKISKGNLNYSYSTLYANITPMPSHLTTILANGFYQQKTTMICMRPEVNNNTLTYCGASSTSDAMKYLWTIGHKDNTEYLISSHGCYSTAGIDKNGKVAISSQTQSVVLSTEICGTNPKIYIESRNPNSSMNIVLYFNYFDKIVQMKYIDHRSIFLTNGTAKVIGQYEDFFLGANNDYFCVKNGKLYYFKNDQ